MHIGLCKWYVKLALNQKRLTFIQIYTTQYVMVQKAILKSPGDKLFEVSLPY